MYAVTLARNGQVPYAGRPAVSLILPDLRGGIHDALLNALDCFFLVVLSHVFGLPQAADIRPDILDAVASQQCLGAHVRHDATHLSQR